ncbi:MAG TPA: hypothetical protein VGY54_03865 [Polyangiaceae bacterium]|nr:hypothetical protein [Polyangiaceae bacterium]
MGFMVAVLELMTARLWFRARAARLVPASAKLAPACRSNPTIGNSNTNAGGVISTGAISLLLYAVGLPRSVMWRLAGMAALTLACPRTMACAFSPLSPRAGLGGRVLS